MSICHATKHLTLDLSSVESDCTGGLLQKYYTGEQPLLAAACYTVFLHMIFPKETVINRGSNPYP